VNVLLIEPSSKSVSRVTGTRGSFAARPYSTKWRSPSMVTATASPGMPYCSMIGFIASSTACRTLAPWSGPAARAGDRNPAVQARRAAASLEESRDSKGISL
jgi:hypothetical protein